MHTILVPENPMASWGDRDALENASIASLSEEYVRNMLSKFVI